MFGWFKKKPIDKTIYTFKLGNLTVSIYTDKRWLHIKMAERMMYKKRRGYYYKGVREIHCIKNMGVLGHEMFHVFKLIGGEE